jgi:WD40 repeat protein
MVSCGRILNARTSCALLASLAFLIGIIPSSSAQKDRAKAPAKELPLGLGIRCVAFSPDGKLLAATLGIPVERGRVVLWDVDKRKQLWSQTSERGVPAVAFSPDGTTLAIGGYDNVAKLLDTATGKVLKTFAGHKNYVRAVAFAPDGKTLATAGWDQTVKLWNVADTTVRKTLEWPGERIYNLSFSPGGQWLVGSEDPLRIWNAATGMEKRAIGGDQQSMTWAAFVDDHWFLAGDGNGVAVFNVATGEERIRFRAWSTRRIAYSAKAQRLALAGQEIQLFDFSFQEPTAAQNERFAALLKQLDDDDYAVREAAGKEVLAIGFVLEPELRRVVKETKSVEVRIRCRRLREALLSKPRATLIGHTEEVDGLAFSPDGRLLASGSFDGSVRLWSVSEAKEIARFGPANDAATDR